MDGASSDAGGGCGAAGCLPADVPALGGALGGGWDRRPSGPPSVGGVAPGGAGGRGDADGGSLPDAARGLEREALLLLVPSGRREAQLRLGEGQAAGGRGGSQVEGPGRAPQAAGAGALAGDAVYQDGSTHEWAQGRRWDLIVTMDDATSEHCSMFFCEQEGTWSSFRDVREVIEAKGLFCSLYTDRDSHYWTTPEARSPTKTRNGTGFKRRPSGRKLVLRKAP